MCYMYNCETCTVCYMYNWNMDNLLQDIKIEYA